MFFRGEVGLTDLLKTREHDTKMNHLATSNQGKRELTAILSDRLTRLEQRYGERRGCPPTRPDPRTECIMMLPCLFVALLIGALVFAVRTGVPS